MDNIKDFYIIGEPIDTDIGMASFIKVREYPYFIKHLYFLLLTKEDLLEAFEKLLKESPDIKVMYDFLKVSTLFEFIKTIRDQNFRYFGLYNLYEGYKELFKFCFREDVFDKIESNDEFNYYINLIIEMNSIPNERPNPNPEIAWFEKLERMAKERNSEKLTFEAMHTSIEAYTGRNPNNMTLYKFHKLFYRISQFKNYDTSTLFKTVDADGKVKIDVWYKDEAGNKKATVSLNELMNKQRKL